MGLGFLLISFVAFSTGYGAEMWVAPIVGTVFILYSLFDERRLRRIVTLLLWPLILPAILAITGWSSFQLWSAASSQVVRAWPYSGSHLWSSSPLYFSFITVLHLFVLVQSIGILYILWLSIQSQRGASA